MSKQAINKPTPINEEVMWSKTKTTISTTNRFGSITDIDQTFIDVCDHSASELLGKPHNIIRHPDIPEIVFKVTRDNILAGHNSHATIKSSAKSGRYYWVVTDSGVGRNTMDGVVTIMARCRAVPQHVITDHIEPLYQTLLKLEKIGGMEPSNRYSKGFLGKRGKSYIEYVIDILDDSKCEIRFEPVDTHTDAGSTLGDYEISDDIFSKDHEEENILQHKGFFVRLFSTD